MNKAGKIDIKKYIKHNATEIIIVRIEPELKEKLQEIAEDNDTTMSGIVRALILNAAENYKPRKSRNG